MSVSARLGVWGFSSTSALFHRCTHCNRLAPEYEQAAKELHSLSPPIPLAKVDATKETSLAKQFEVDGYPTLKVFHDGTPYDYAGPRVADGGCMAVAC